MATSPDLEEKLDKIIELLTLLLMYTQMKGEPNPAPSPYIPPLPNTPYTPYEPNTCGVCNMKFDGPMGYVCPRNDCPSRVTC